MNGAPPPGERRFVPDQVLCVLRDGLSENDITRFLRRHRMARTAGGRQRVALIGGPISRYRITDRRSVATVIAALRRDPRVLFAQPNYRYDLAQEAVAEKGADPAQYVVGKMQLRQAHTLVRGEKILVAVIDSAVDANHPELEGTVVKQIDLVGGKDVAPHSHGTAMAGAIVARSKLTGVAPAAHIIAIRAFAANDANKPSGTSFQLMQALDSAVAAGARVINLSFAGPPDPMLAQAMKAAHERGAVLVAAMGNAGENAGPLYPAADPSVIAVTATDAGDHLFADASRGKHVAVAAPGVDILVPAPGAEYALSTGTSVAAAHVSGVVALLLSRRASLEPSAIREVLRASARKTSSENDAAEALGAGIADAYGAVTALDAVAPTEQAPGSTEKDGAAVSSR